MVTWIYNNNYNTNYAEMAWEIVALVTNMILSNMEKLLIS